MKNSSRPGLRERIAAWWMSAAHPSVPHGTPTPEEHEAFLEETPRLLWEQEDFLTKGVPDIPEEDGYLPWILARLNQHETDPRLKVTVALMNVSAEFAPILAAEFRQAGWVRDQDTISTNVDLGWRKNGVRLCPRVYGSHHGRPLEGTLYHILPRRTVELDRVMPSSVGVAYPTPVDQDVFEIAWALVQAGTRSDLALEMARELQN